MEINTVIIIFVLVIAVIIFNKEKFIVENNKDNLATNINLDPETNLLTYGPSFEEINFQAITIDASGNELHIVGRGLKSDKKDDTNFIYTEDLQIYADEDLTNLITSYKFNNNLNNNINNYNFYFNNPWILWLFVILICCTISSLSISYLYFSK